MGGDISDSICYWLRWGPASRESLERLVKEGGHVNDQGGEYGYALQAASLNGDLNVVRFLVEKGADVNAQGGKYGYALQAASCMRNLGVVQFLVEEGADVNAQGGEYVYALQAASYMGHLDIVQFLLEKGANVNAQGGEYGYALQTASYTGKLDIVRVLTENGADINAEGGEYGYALQAASYKGRLDIARFLLGKGADVNAPGGKYGYALQAASYMGELDIVQILVESDADVNAQGGKYGYALQAASYTGNLDIVRFLVEKGANVNAEGGHFGYALQAALVDNYLGIVQFLVEKGADANVQGGRDGSPLDAVIPSSQLALLRSLLQNKASTSRLSAAKDGSSLLHAAISAGHLSLLQLLFEHGASTRIESKDLSGRTPLHRAATVSDLSIIGVLEPHLTDFTFNIQDIDGRSPLHLAVESQNLPCIQWLLEHTANPNTIDYCDVSPFKLAFLHKNAALIQCLFSKINHNLYGNAFRSSEWKNAFNTANIVMTFGESPFVERFNDTDLGTFLNERMPAISTSITEIQVDGELSKSVLGQALPPLTMILCNDSFLSPVNRKPGLYWRWWRKVLDHSVNDMAGTESRWVWTVHLEQLPSRVGVAQTTYDDSFLWCHLAIPTCMPFQSSSTPYNFQSYKLQIKTHSLTWIMRKPSIRELSNTSPTVLQSGVFLTTLDHAKRPAAATDFFQPFVCKLSKEWKETFDSLHEHLAHIRSVSLGSNGTNAAIIQVLLKDSMEWQELEKLVKQQKTILNELADAYMDKRGAVIHEQGGDETRRILGLFSTDIENMEGMVKAGIERLSTTTKELIELEFNLASIVEVQRSTSMSKSLKRLSWVTFIFLPLMFIASLFGMNVDILVSNPHWWLYAIFGIGTLLLTFSIWIVFKHFEGLEGHIEERFRGLLRRRNPRDIEHGVGVTTSENMERTIDLLTRKKKRS